MMKGEFVKVCCPSLMRAYNSHMDIGQDILGGILFSSRVLAGPGLVVEPVDTHSPLR